MATRRQYVPQGPSLRPEQAIPILEEQIRKADALESEPSNSTKRAEWIHTSNGALTAALGTEDSALGSFSSAQCGAYGPRDTPESLRRQSNKMVGGMLAVLRSAAERLRWQLPDPQQVFLPAGSPHDAYVRIRSIIQQATTDLFIVDPWIDESLWTLLTNLPASCSIRILGQNFKGDFALEAKKFAAQYGFKIEIRKTQTFHDRFIFLDGKRCFHLGASIKDAGAKAFALSELERNQVVAAAIADAESEWSRSPIVTI